MPAAPEALRLAFDRCWGELAPAMLTDDDFEAVRARLVDLRDQAPPDKHELIDAALERFDADRRIADEYADRFEAGR